MLLRSFSVKRATRSCTRDVASYSLHTTCRRHANLEKIFQFIFILILSAGYISAPVKPSPALFPRITVTSDKRWNKVTIFVTFVVGPHLEAVDEADHAVSLRRQHPATAPQNPQQRQGSPSGSLNGSSYHQPSLQRLGPDRFKSSPSLHAWP